MSSADDQHFLDILSSFPNDVQRYTFHIAEVIDHGFDSVALAFREHLTNSTWVPDAVRPVVKRSTPPRIPARVAAPLGYFGSAWRWIDRHRAVSVALCTFFGTGTFLYYQQKKSYTKKRRAKRSLTGAKQEVIVVAGTPGAPITQSIAADLERRGFIVYIVVSSASEEDGVRAEAKGDVHPLHLNMTDTFDVQYTMEQFRSLFTTSAMGASGQELPALTFSGLIVVPDVIYPAGPIETISPELWSDALNVKIFHTIATTQAFLRIVREHKARLLVLTPGIVASLLPPFHSVESTVVRALEGFTMSLTAEMSTQGVHVCQFKLGSFESGHFESRSQVKSSERAEVHSWPTATHAAYADNNVNHRSERDDLGLVSGNKARSKGSSLRELNNAVFDALTQVHPRRTWRVGKGSVLYDVVGRLVPPGIVGWMTGMRMKPAGATALNQGQLVVAKNAHSSMTGSGQWEKVERIS